MAKPMTTLTGKGFIVNMGQDKVESYLLTHSQAQLAELAGMFKGSDKVPNAGAVSNILRDLRWASFNGKPVVEKKQATEKQPAEKKVLVAEFIGPPVEKFLPGRIELLLELLGHDLNIDGILAAIEQNHEKWCSQIRKMGNEERELMREFTGMNEWTLADIGHARREAIRLAPWKISAETVAKFAGIDSSLVARETRFESSRYDADLVDFYTA